MMKLPMIDPCVECTTGCCTSYIVPLSGFDVWRLCRGLQLPWQEVAEVRSAFAHWEGFALHAGGARFGLFLRARPRTDTCHFLMQLPGGAWRCGVHAVRPMACRIYPYKPSESGGELSLKKDAMCPAPSQEWFGERRLEALTPVQEELAERQLHLFAVTRWNQHMARSPHRYDVEVYLDWILRLYDALLPLRAAEGFTEAAREKISAVAMP
jgi:Fe-S-cluster containining protein